MERERHSGNDRLRDSSDGPPDGDSLNQQRPEHDASLQAADRAFDAINNIHAQE